MIAGGSPGAHVICSTARCLSSHTLGDMLRGLPSLSRAGMPSFFMTGIFGSRALMLAAGHISPVGAKIYWCFGM